MCGCTSFSTIFRRAWIAREHTRGEFDHFALEPAILPAVHKWVEGGRRKGNEVHPGNHETRVQHGTFVHAQESEHANLGQEARERHEDNCDHGFIHTTVSGILNCSMRRNVLKVDVETHIKIFLKQSKPRSVNHAR